MEPTSFTGKKYSELSTDERAEFKRILETDHIQSRLYWLLVPDSAFESKGSELSLFDSLNLGRQFRFTTRMHGDKNYVVAQLIRSIGPGQNYSHAAPFLSDLIIQRIEIDHTPNPYPEDLDKRPRRSREV